jgi:hypothetical protein
MTISSKSHARALVHCMYSDKDGGMTMTTALQAIKTFAADFAREPLFSTGYAEVMRTCGITAAEDDVEMREALAFVVGYAQACRMATTYLSREWEIAHLMVTSAGVLGYRLRIGSYDKIPSILDTHRRELAALTAKVAS